MPDEVPQTDGHLENPSVRYEKTDANFRWILGIVLVSMVLAVLIFALIHVFFSRERATLDARRKSTFPLAPEPSRALPPEPRLEPLDRAAEITSSNVYLREKARLEVLDNYGPTPEKGYIHIPIDQAMRLLKEDRRLADRWLPARAEADPEVQRRQNGLVDGGEPNSGRLFNRRNPQWLGR